MTNKPCILSKRYEDDGVAEDYIFASNRRLAKFLRKSLLIGELERLSHKKCPLCNGVQLLLIARKERLGLPLETLICKRCGLVFSATYYSNQAANIYYSTYCNKFKNMGRSAEEMFRMRTQPTAYSWLRYNWIKENLGEEFAKIKTVMEIGSNDGCNLYPFHQNGCIVFGCDYDEDRMNAGRAVGMILLSGGVEQLGKLQTRADLVIFSHTLEHMPDVDFALQEAIKLLSPDGKVYIEVPGLKFWNRPRSKTISNEWMKSGNNFLLYLQMEHAYCFEWRTLVEFTGRNGLVPIVGDEFIHGLFEKGPAKDGTDFGKTELGNIVYDYLLEVEQDWQARNSPWMRAAKFMMKRFYVMNQLARYWVRLRDR